MHCLVHATSASPHDAPGKGRVQRRRRASHTGLALWRGLGPGIFRSTLPLAAAACAGDGRVSRGGGGPQHEGVMGRRNALRPCVANVIAGKRRPHRTRSVVENFSPSFFPCTASHPKSPRTCLRSLLRDWAWA